MRSWCAFVREALTLIDEVNLRRAAIIWELKPMQNFPSHIILHSQQINGYFDESTHQSLRKVTLQIVFHVWLLYTDSECWPLMFCLYPQHLRVFPLPARFPWPAEAPGLKPFPKVVGQTILIKEYTLTAKRMMWPQCQSQLTHILYLSLSKSIQTWMCCGCCDANVRLHLSWNADWTCENVNSTCYQ